VGGSCHDRVRASQPYGGSGAVHERERREGGGGEGMRVLEIVEERETGSE